MTIVLVLALQVVGVTPTATEQAPIIDMHMHAGAPGAAAGAAPPCFPIAFGVPAPGPAKADDELLRSTLEAMRRHNVRLGFLSDSQLNVETWLAAAPDRF